jgi:hypothetical protein
MRFKEQIIGINPLKHKKIGSMFTLNEVPTKKKKKNY